MKSSGSGPSAPTMKGAPCRGRTARYEDRDLARPGRGPARRHDELGRVGGVGRAEGAGVARDAGGIDRAVGRVQRELVHGALRHVVARAVSGAGVCVGPMMKLPLPSAGGTVPSGSSVAFTKPGRAGRAWAASAAAGWRRLHGGGLCRRCGSGGKTRGCRHAHQDSRARALVRAVDMHFLEPLALDRTGYHAVERVPAQVSARPVHGRPGIRAEMPDSVRGPPPGEQARDSTIAGHALLSPVSIPPFGCLGVARCFPPRPYLVPLVLRPVS